MFGRGLLKGLRITFREFFSKKVTEFYPEERPVLSENFHGRFVMNTENCIGCTLCARACPNEVIKIETERIEKKRVVKSFVMDIQYCLFCGLCVEACNSDALHFSTDFEMAQYFKENIPLVMIDTAKEGN